ncbi:MAG: serine hydrolase, partial [Actinomycetota bacterium]
MRPESRHLLMSITKSMTAAALGVAIGRNLLSIDDQVTAVAPEFVGTSLEGCSVRHLINMSAGTEFVEDYELYKLPDSDHPLIEYERQSG